MCSGNFRRARQKRHPPLDESRRNHRPYLVTDGGIRRILQRVYPEEDFTQVTFDKLTIPLIVTATNIMRGRSETFASGPVTPALLASSAIPGLLRR